MVVGGDSSLAPGAFSSFGAAGSGLAPQNGGSLLRSLGGDLCASGSSSSSSSSNIENLLRAPPALHENLLRAPPALHDSGHSLGASLFAPHFWSPPVAPGPPSLLLHSAGLMDFSVDLGAQARRRETISGKVPVMDAGDDDAGEERSLVLGITEPGLSSFNKDRPFPPQHPQPGPYIDMSGLVFHQWETSKRLPTSTAPSFSSAVNFQGRLRRACTTNTSSSSSAGAAAAPAASCARTSAASSPSSSEDSPQQNRDYSGAGSKISGGSAAAAAATTAPTATAASAPAPPAAALAPLSAVVLNGAGGGTAAAKKRKSKGDGGAKAGGAGRGGNSEGAAGTTEKKRKMTLLMLQMTY